MPSREPTRRELLTGLISLNFCSPLPAASAPAGSLRITGYEVIPVRVPMHERVRDVFAEAYRKQGILRDYYDSTLVKLHTDEGLTGIGDALLNVADSLGSVPRAEAILKRMVGRSPWEFLLDDSIGGILMAVYDLIGQVTGLPVSKLFAARPENRIVQTWWSQCFPPEVMASEARLGARLGYKVHKVKARPFEDPIEQAEAICSVVPRDFRIWVDSNWTWGSVGKTLAVTERLSQFHNYFAIESPIPREDLAGYRALKGRSPLSVAEHIPRDPMPFIREGLVDALVVGGPVGKTAVQRALMAEVTRIPLWIEHSIFTGVSQVFQAHQAAAFPGIEYAISITHVIQDDLMNEPFEMEGGFYTLPTKPGLGVTFDEEAIDRYRRG
ncbi:MAG: mandelate racemase/muconate lactonizing enzyme family protein [bacterium]|nr:mandelate racemase/muconate lactonizing enzyme family protein [bacterium]